MGGLLVRDFTAAFHADLAAYAVEHFSGTSRIWLGADDVAAEGTFTFIDGGLVPLP